MAETAAQTVPATPEVEGQESSTVPCIKCNQPASIQDGGVMRGYGVQCRQCTNVYQILYRHLGGIPPTLQSMSCQEQMDFFKGGGQMLKTCPKNGRWAVVRSHLHSSMVRFKTEQVKTTIRREFLPLSVWQARGFDVQQIQQNGEKSTDAVPPSMFTFLPLFIFDDTTVTYTMHRSKLVLIVT